MDNGAGSTTLRAAVAMNAAAPPLPRPAQTSFFGDDWDDVLEAMPTVRDARKPAPAPAAPANDVRRSGVWRKRPDVPPLPAPRAPEAELAIPLVVRWVDPADVLEELHADPFGAVAGASAPTLEVLPWEVEVLEDTLELRASLQPPSLLGPLPVLAVTTPRARVSPAWWIAPAAVLGFAIAACGWALAAFVAR